ncbi:hypothetical protein GQ651_07740 [Alphaproteobacteria bacterium GH1-50]|uniref:Uncharacterized protein n=2 Tax=Kangsaoukella pontilimi TaxID=2691042 RepID=A0A7C9MJG5_9RHOB|nr:hypothetical protein [Kangsaoukella pontilimi]
MTTKQPGLLGSIRHRMSVMRQDDTGWQPVCPDPNPPHDQLDVVRAYRRSRISQSRQLSHSVS